MGLHDQQDVKGRPSRALSHRRQAARKAGKARRDSRGKGRRLSIDLSKFEVKKATRQQKERGLTKARVDRSHVLTRSGKLFVRVVNRAVAVHDLGRDSTTLFHAHNGRPRWVAVDPTGVFAASIQYDLDVLFVWLLRPDGGQQLKSVCRVPAEVVALSWVGGAHIACLCGGVRASQSVRIYHVSEDGELCRRPVVAAAVPDDHGFFADMVGHPERPGTVVLHGRGGLAFGAPGVAATKYSRTPALELRACGMPAKVQQSAVACVSFIGKSRFAAGFDSGHTVLYDRATPLVCIYSHKGPVLSLAHHSGRNELRSFGRDGKVVTWTMGGGRIECTHKAQIVARAQMDRVVSAFMGVNDSGLAVVCTVLADGSVQCVDAATGTVRDLHAKGGAGAGTGAGAVQSVAAGASPVSLQYLFARWFRDDVDDFLGVSEPCFHDTLRARLDAPAEAVRKLWRDVEKAGDDVALCDAFVQCCASKRHAAVGRAVRGQATEAAGRQAFAALCRAIGVQDGVELDKHQFLRAVQRAGAPCGLTPADAAWVFDELAGRVQFVDDSDFVDMLQQPTALLTDWRLVEFRRFLMAQAEAVMRKAVLEFRRQEIQRPRHDAHKAPLSKEADKKFVEGNKERRKKRVAVVSEEFLLQDGLGFQRVLGVGGFGSVIKVADARRRTAPLAVKKVYDCWDGSGAPKPSMVRECRIMEHLTACRHPNIVGFVECYADAEDGYICMEFVESDLRDFYKSRHVPLSESQVRSIAVQLISAVHCMHAAGVIHSDLKPNNILIDPQTLDVKVTDFGLAQPLVTRGRERLVHWGTPHFAAPEILLGIPFDHRVDWWSLMVALLEVVLARNIFHLGVPKAQWSRYEQLRLVFSLVGADAAAFQHCDERVPAFVRNTAHRPWNLAWVDEARDRVGDAGASFFRQFLVCQPAGRNHRQVARHPWVAAELADYERLLSLTGPRTLFNAW